MAAVVTPTVDVVGVGLNALDTLLSVPSYPARGSKVTARTMHVLPGGQVATAMVACSTWGLRARYVGKVGDDAAGAVHVAEFARSGVDTRLVTTRGCASHQSFIVVDDTGERTVVRTHDERRTLRPEELQRDWITDARVLLVDGHDTAAAIVAARWARAAGIPVVADLDAAYAGVDALLASVDVLVTNAALPAQLTGRTDLESALRMLQERHGTRLTGATLGDKGVVAWDGRRLHRVAAYRVDVIDTTGAGDVFHAGLVYGMLQGMPVERQLAFACAAAALNCTAIGARGGLAPVVEIERLMGTREKP